MKRCLPLALAAMLFSTVTVAQIPNGGFENWTPGTGYEDPTGWFTSNIISGLFQVATVERGTPAPVGSAYAQLTTKEVFEEPFGAFAIATFPYTQRPQAFTGRIQYMANPGDPVTAGAMLTRWNPGSGTFDVIGVAEAEYNGSGMAWQQFSLSFQYESALDPDTAYVILLSSGGATATLNNYAGFDDLSFGAPVSIEELASPALRLFPSPAIDVVRISAAQPLQAVEVWSNDGRLVHSQRALGLQVEVDVQALATGLYRVRATLSDGSLLQGTFVKE